MAWAAKATAMVYCAGTVFLMAKGYLLALGQVF